MTGPADSILDVERAVLKLAFAAYVSAVALRLCDPMLPAIGAEFGATPVRAAVVVTSTTVSYGLALLFIAYLGDRFGKFRVIAVASLLSTFAAIASALSPSLSSLVCARGLNGATTAALIPLSMAWVGDHVSLQKRQTTLAVLMSGQIAGLITGQLLGGLFADTVGWRWSFALLAVVYLVCSFTLLRSPYNVACSRLAHAGWTAVVQPAFDVLRMPRARAVLLVVLFESMGTYGLLTYLPGYLHTRFGLSLFHSGAVVAVFGVGGLLYTLAARHWVRMLGQRRLAAIGGASVGAAFVALAFTESWGWCMAAAALAGTGFYFLHNTLQTLATQMAPERRGVAVSLFATFFFLGTAAGVTAGGMAIDKWGMSAALLVAGLALPALGLFAARIARPQ